MKTFLRNLIYLFKHDLDTVVNLRKEISKLERELIAKESKERYNLAVKELNKPVNKVSSSQQAIDKYFRDMRRVAEADKKLMKDRYFTEDGRTTT